MDFKIGDIVHPKNIIPVSNKKNMFDDEEGTVIDIVPYDEHYLVTVRRNRDGETFKAIDFLWEHA